MKNTNLLASAPTLEALENLIAQYFCSPNYRVNGNLEIVNQKTGKKPDGFRVVSQRGRYRFERV